MQAELEWTLAALALALAAAAMWAWIVVEGVDMMGMATTAGLRTRRLVRTGTTCTLFLVAAYGCWSAAMPHSTGKGHHDRTAFRPN